MCLSAVEILPAENRGLDKGCRRVFYEYLLLLEGRLMCLSVLHVCNAGAKSEAAQGKEEEWKVHFGGSYQSSGS